MKLHTRIPAPSKTLIMKACVRAIGRKANINLHNARATLADEANAANEARDTVITIC